jgi:hypothetical protein
MKISSLINDHLLAHFDVRLVHASLWRAQQDNYKRLESLAGSPQARERIIQIARLLVPVKAIGHQKMRFGDRNDGGYVCLNDLQGIKTAFSFGIAQNVTWDIAIADQNILVYQLDHTVDASPIMHPNFHFQKAKVVPVKKREHSAEESISSLLARHTDRRIASVILKMDVEHDEWEILASASRDDLRVFSQVICEFHGFDSIMDQGWYRRAFAVLAALDRDFAVVHVHGNNCRPLLSIGNMSFPEVLEVTYANRAKYRFELTAETFPTPLDAPNDSNRADITLSYLYPHE